MQNAELGLTGPELHLVIAEADENADGTIDYYEFIPLAYNLVDAFRARRRACEEMDEANLDLDQQAIHALYDAEFDRLVRQLKALCKSHDPNGTGVLPRAEFKQCISADRCGGLTKIESKLLLNLLPKDSHGNVVYRKLGAGLEQVRFTTLRNTVAEASASDTQKYLMALCREEEAKSDPLGNKGHMKTNGDAVAIGGKHYSGVLRARQLTKLLLNAPLLSLSRLHVTALMSQANILDGMVNYVELVPMIAKTIEGMFHPWSLKMRHEIFNNNRGPGGGVGVGGGVGEGGAQQQQGAGTTTVRGKSRDDIQRKIVEILREDKQGAVIERLRDPATFARCMASLGLDLEPDTINALWVAADLDTREGTTFVDVVDFCFNCVLFMEREKEARVKILQRARSTGTSASQSNMPGRAAPGAAAVARAEAVAAAALVAGEPSAGKVDPLLSLARSLVRHAKVTTTSEGKVGLEFPLDKHASNSVHGSSASGEAERSSADGQSKEARHKLDDCGGFSFAADAEGMGFSVGYEDDQVEPFGDGHSSNSGNGRTGEDKRDTAGLNLRSEAPNATIILRARRKVPVVGPSGQPITFVSSNPSSSSPTSNSDASSAVAAGEEGGLTLITPPGKHDDAKTATKRDSSCSSGLETADASRGETRDMVVRLYWDGAARDRAYVEAYPTRKGGGRVGGEEGGQRVPLRLGVRVPTLAIVDSHAASKFADRVARGIVIQVGDEKDDSGGGKKPTSGRAKRQQHHHHHQEGERLRLAGVDAKSVIVGDSSGVA
ncbi:unnamed protein product [Ectocarpus sp. 12 AP-2014]